jgi:tol-pal system protein YbgF
LNAKVDTLSESVDKNSAFRKESQESNRSMRRSQADFNADMTSIRSELRELRGSIEKLGASDSSQKEKRKYEKETIENIAARISYIEKYIGIPERELIKREGQGKGPDLGRAMEEKERVYSEAYALFKSGKYGEARKKFSAFMVSFPDTEYSDNAQFWIGECYYFEGDYEKAILEYEKVISNYPKGNKIPGALLKQALCFLKLGDKSSSNMILQRIIKDYPGTSPAKIARSKLAETK